MKTKFMKKMIALICAAVMTTSCATASVGALVAKPGASEEFVTKVGGLNLKIEDYISSLENASSRLSKDCLYDNDGKTNTGKTIRHIIHKIKHIIKGKLNSSYNSLSTLKSCDLVVYDENHINNIEIMINAMKSDVDDLVDKANSVSIDKENDKVFYTEIARTMNIDENKDNGDKKELTIYYREKFFGKSAKNLLEKVKKVLNYIGKEMNEKGKENINNISAEDAEMKEKFSKKLNEYKFACKKCDFNMSKSYVRGRVPKDLVEANEKLTGHRGFDFKIPLAKMIEYTSSSQSMNNAISLMDNYIDQLEKYELNYLLSTEEKFKINNMTIDDALTHIEEYLNLVDNDKYKYKEIKDNKEIDNRDLLFSLPEYKEGNKNFNLAIKKLKPKTSVKKLEELRFELMELYMNDDLSENDRAQKIGDTAKKTREELQNIKDKINQNNQNQG